MAGYEVSRGSLDQKSAEAIIAVREAFRKVRNVKSALDNVPNPAETGDALLTGSFDYSADEAYLLRTLFADLAALDVQPLLDKGRKLTGLE